MSAAESKYIAAAELKQCLKGHLKTNAVMGHNNCG